MMRERFWTWVFGLAVAALGLKLVPLDAEIVSKAEKQFMAEKMIEHYQAILDAD